MKVTSMRLTVLGLCLVMLAATVPGLVQSPAVAGPRVMKPGDDGGGSGGGPTLENVLIRADKPYTDVIAAINAAGGSVTRTYNNFDGIAARIPRSAIATIGALTGPERISKDFIVPAPGPAKAIGKTTYLQKVGGGTQAAFESATAIAAADFAGFAANNPDAYLINNASTHANVLHAAGFAGQGIVVGIIDSGIRPGFPHLGLDGSVIGCEDFVGDANGCSHPGNSGHGTFVAGMVSSNVIFSFGPGTLLNAVTSYMPAAVINGNQIPMIGSAPLSSIYAFRVFPPTGGAPTSFILAAMDRAIELRELYEDGDPSGVKISVVNMSLGGPTLNAGRDIFDTAVEAMAAADIVVVTSAGNAGPSGMTTGSPASAYSSLAVGAASVSANERIVRDLQFGSGIGGFYRPTTHLQSATFSSRGPSADGRLDPDISASGDWNYGQGFFTIPTSITFGSGTSFSSPTIAGVAAILRQAHPGANAAQIHNAIAMTGNPAAFGDNSTVHDRGTGYVDVTAADALLATGTVPTTLPTPPPFVKSVANNIETNAGLDVVTGNHTSHVGPLLPGERGEIFYKIGPNTAQVVVSVFNFSAELPPAQQNPFFGDDFFVAIHQAKTSRQPGSSGYFVPSDFTTGNTYVINNPEPGIFRVTVSGDWTNAGRVEGDVNIFSIADPLPGSTDQGRVAEGDLIFVPFNVPAGTSAAEFRLSWREDWASYPLNDIDLILIDPNGNLNFDGATLNSPERTSVANPMAGTWNAVVSGFEFHTTDDKYDLRIALDGNVVH